MFELAKKNEVVTQKELCEGLDLQLRNAKDVLIALRNYGLRIEYSRKKHGWEIIAGESDFLRAVANDIVTSLPSPIYPQLIKTFTRIIKGIKVILIKCS